MNRKHSIFANAAKTMAMIWRVGILGIAMCAVPLVGCSELETLLNGEEDEEEEDEEVITFGERVAKNMPIQGAAADIIKIAMVRVYNRLKKDILAGVSNLTHNDERPFCYSFFIL